MKRLRKVRVGFTMVEVMLALGLVVFCLVALLTLLPAGLGSVKESVDEAAAVTCMEQIVESIRKAVPQPADKTSYKAAGVYGDTLVWSLAGTPLKVDFGGLAPGGFPATATRGHLYKARVEIFPPPSLVSAGSAMVSVAWPVQAEWDVPKGEWVNAQGSVNTWVVFIPEQ